MKIVEYVQGRGTVLHRDDVLMQDVPYHVALPRGVAPLGRNERILGVDEVDGRLGIQPDEARTLLAHQDAEPLTLALEGGGRYDFYVRDDSGTIVRADEPPDSGRR